MSSLKDMYRTVLKDTFPDTMTITLGDAVLTYKKRTWHIDGETKGLRYGENPDQPAALYEMESGKLAIDGVEWRGPQGIMSALTEAQMLRPEASRQDQPHRRGQRLQHPPIPRGTPPPPSSSSTTTPAERRGPRKAWATHWPRPSGATASPPSAGPWWSTARWTCRPPTSSPPTILKWSPAPDFEEGVLEKLAARKNLRIFKLPALARLGELAGVPFLDVKSMADGGIILQQSFVNRIRSAADFIPAVATTKDGLTVSARKPTPQEADDLVFAWAVEAGVTSNSVIFAHNGATVAIGTGEQDRVGCVELAIFKAYTKYADTLAFTRHGMTLYELKLKAKEDAEAAEQLAAIEADTQKAKGGLSGTVLVSDGFFPFRDGVDVCIAQGVTAIAQPGGSLRDYEVIGAVNEASPRVAMVFTGQRSFKH